LPLVWVPQLLKQRQGYSAAGLRRFYGCAADVGGFGESVDDANQSIRQTMIPEGWRV